MKGTQYYRKGEDIRSYSGENLTSQVKRELKDEGWRNISIDTYTQLLSKQQSRQQVQVKGEHGTNIDV